VELQYFSGHKDRGLIFSCRLPIQKSNRTL